MYSQPLERASPPSFDSKAEAGCGRTAEITGRLSKPKFHKFRSSPGIIRESCNFARKLELGRDLAQFRDSSKKYQGILRDFLVPF